MVIMKTIILILLLFSFGSCTKYSQVEVSKTGSFKVIPDGVRVVKLRDRPWHVGKKGKQLLSFGLTVKLTIPKIKASILKEILKNADVDSAILEIRRVYQGKTIPIGAMLVPAEYLTGQKAKEIYFDLIYHAASIRPSHTKFECVPFDRNYKLGDFSIERNSTLNKTFTVSSAYNHSYRNVVLPFQYQNQTFTSGLNLQGEFLFRFALYNQGQKELRSSFYDYQQKVVVGAEEKLKVKGCFGTSGEGKLRDTNSQFNWNRK